MEEHTRIYKLGDKHKCNIYKKINMERYRMERETEWMGRRKDKSEVTNQKKQR